MRPEIPVAKSSAGGTTNLPSPAAERPRGRPPRIREMVLADYERIRALQLRNGLTSRPRKKWVSYWTGNPAYESRRQHWPLGWVLETEEGETVGSITNIPLAYQHRGCTLRAATGAAWVVDPLYRGYSLLMLAEQMKQDGVDLLVATTVSAAAEPAYQVFCWTRGAGNWDESAFRITGYGGFANSVLKTKSVPALPIARWPLSAALRCREAIRFPKALVCRDDLEIRLCPAFDDRFDAFWEELTRERENAVIAVRTRETLAWHYGDALDRGSVWIISASRGSRLVAYAVFDRRDKPECGLTRMRLVDCQALGGALAAVPSMVLSAIEKCRREGIHVLENPGCWLERWPDARRLLPDRRTQQSWTHYYRANGAALVHAMQDPAVWAPSCFDGDASL